MKTYGMNSVKIRARLLLDSVGHGWAQLQNLATDGVAHYVKVQLLANQGYPYEPRGREFESLRARQIQKATPAVAFSFRKRRDEEHRSSTTRCPVNIGCI